jgi:hypothetical protein
MPAADLATTLTDYARFISAPVRTATTVRALRAAPAGFEIRAGDDLLCARAVVLATGACTRPAIPGIAEAIPAEVTTLTALAYRDPGTGRGELGCCADPGSASPSRRATASRQNRSAEDRVGGTDRSRVRGRQSCRARVHQPGDR